MTVADCPIAAGKIRASCALAARKRCDARLGATTCARRRSRVGRQNGFILRALRVLRLARRGGHGNCSLSI